MLGTNQSRQSLSEILPTSPVKAIGDLRLIATNELNHQIKFSSLTKKTHLYGLGMPRELNSEILVLNGKAYLGKFSSLSYQVKELDDDDFDISFMIYAYVPNWIKIEIPDTVKTFADLEHYIPKVAANNSIDTSRPFPFRIQGEVSALNWFIVNGMGNGVPNYLGSFFRSRYLGGLDDRTIEALGFYSDSHRGVLTNPTSNMHIHFKTTDEQLFIGHINDSVSLKSGSWLLFPHEVQ